MKRVYNFSAGPACLPLAVLEKAQSEFLCYGDSGMSVMEMSHRTPVYQDIFDRATASLRKLMNIPENYEVLYVQGGASMQFDMVPMNLMSTHKKAYYINTGNSTFSLGSGLGTAENNACVYGCKGLSKIAFVPPNSTIEPKYITPILSEMCFTTDKSCEINK